MSGRNDRLRVSHLPDPSRYTTSDGLPILQLDTSNANRTPSQLSVPRGGASSITPSSSFKQNIRVAKRRYSFDRTDSLEEMEMPVFTETEMKLRKKGPSSPTTVLSMAGLFICGLLLMISGILVLVQQSGDLPFDVCGGIFISVGFLMLLICLVLQRKNLVKYILEMNRDLFFLKMDQTPVWGFLFDDKTHELPSPN
ncbi:hypothetical protein M3Y94_00086100 [Aphelenchoides besseyi]|nr:hypothetical protein M3Y94_00086100 [Aphelenchoides besseyi]KAI6237733.1 hypothetical protein M3Y95_00296100 [Aphelenchoides besseyi]